MDQPPQDPSQPAQPAPPAGGPSWGQPPAAPAGGPSWGQQPPAAPPPQYAPPAPPQYAPPQPAPGGWAQPVPGGSGWVQPTATRGPVTGLARIAGLIVAVIACLWAVVGAIIIVGGVASKGVLDNFYNGTDAGNVIGGFFAGIGIVVLVLALIELIGGLGALFGKDWGRIISIIYSLLFGVATILIGLSALAGSRATDTTVSSTSTTGGLFFLAQGVAYAFAALILMARWRGRATA